jgi:hypothetical protein
MLTRPASPLGVSELGIKPSKYGLKNNFADVNQVTFTFLDGRASGVSVTYNGPEYPNVDQFVTRFVEGRNLPPADRWQAHEGLDTQLKILACKEFEVRVFAGGKGGNLNYVQLSDLVASVTLKDRRKKARAKAAASPSPQ